MTEEQYAAHLHNGASTSLHEKAHLLRKHETEAEKKLWSLLRNRQLKGKKFRRQHAYTDYVLDFYCHEFKLAVELDGKYHLIEQNKEHDASRTRYLEVYGVTVIRFWNYEVMNDPDKVLAKIAEYLK